MYVNDGRDSVHEFIGGAVGPHKGHVHDREAGNPVSSQSMKLDDAY